MSVSSAGQHDEEKAVARAAYSAPEVAEMLGVSEASIWRAARRGELKKIKFGGRTLFTARSVELVLHAA